MISHHRGSFLLQQTGTNTDTKSQTLCREKETLRHAAIKWDGSIKSIVSGLRESYRRGRKSVRARQEEDIKETTPSKSTGSKHIWTHRNWNGIHRACTRWGSRAEGEMHTWPYPKTRISEGLSRVDCMPSRTWLKDTKLSGSFGASLSHNVMPGLLIHLFAYFNLFLVPSLGLLPFSLFVCFVFFCFSIPMCWFLFYLIILHFVTKPTEACLVSNNRQKVEVGGAWRSRGRGRDWTQVVVYEKKNYFQ